MPLVNAGRNLLAQCVVNDSPTFLDNANAHLAVGDSDTAHAVGQTDLQAATNKLRKGMEATYPQRTDNVLTFRSVFGTAEANFAWKEWALFNAAATGSMLNRKVEDMGVKTNHGTWQLTVTVTLNIA